MNESSTQFTLLFMALLLKLTSCENHVHGATAALEATLTLCKDVVFTDVLFESIKNDTG